MADAPEKPSAENNKGGADAPPPKIRIKPPGDKPEIKIRKVEDDKGAPAPEPPAPAAPADAPAAPEKKKATVRIAIPGSKPGADEPKTLKVRMDQGSAGTPAPKGPLPEADGLPKSVRIRGPKGDSQQFDLDPSAAAETPSTKTPTSPGQPAPPGAGPPATGGKPTDTQLGRATSAVTPPERKTNARLLKPQAVAAGASQERAPSYAGGVKVKRKGKAAGPVVSTFAVLAAIVGLAVVYLLVAQALPDLGLPMRELF